MVRMRKSLWSSNYYFVLSSFVAGINKWSGKQMHSHNYRDPKPFQDQVRASFLFSKYPQNI